MRDQSLNQLHEFWRQAETALQVNAPSMQFTHSFELLLDELELELDDASSAMHASTQLPLELDDERLELDAIQLHALLHASSTGVPPLHDTIPAARQRHDASTAVANQSIVFSEPGIAATVFDQARFRDGLAATSPRSRGCSFCRIQLQ